MGAPRPRISVIIPTYNRRADVVRAVMSVLEQTLAPHQVIVVDDGSTDDTEQAVRSLPEPVLYVRKENGGVSSARNLGFKHVSGDYVCLLDSDDRWAPDWLETATSAIQRTPGAAAAACTQLALVDPEGRSLGVRNSNGLASGGVVLLPKLMLGGIMGSNLCLRTELLADVGEFDPMLRTGEDMDFALRVAALTRIAAVERPLIYVTHSLVSLSKHVDTGNRLRVYDQFERRFPGLALRHHKDIQSARVDATLGYVRDLIWDRRLSEARSRVRESWQLRPTWAAFVLGVKIELLSLVAKRNRAP